MRHLSVSLLALAVCLPAPVMAQSDDRGYLQALLEDNLSGAGRKVTITGFAGALSSRATIQQLTIADDEGVWITLDDVVLDWSRTALLSGSVIVNELSASSIVLERLPAGEESTATPEASSFEFSLPDLPVSIDIGKVSAPKIQLGPTILGQPLTGTLSANLHLAGGEGNGALQIERTDNGPEGLIALNAGYVNQTGVLSLDLNAREGADGIVASKLGLPGTPAASLVLQGQGTLQNFAANFILASDGEERLAGPITVTQGDQGETGFVASLKGNPAPLFLPEYAEFLGNALDFTVTGSTWPSGEVRVDGLTLHSQSLNLVGRAVVGADGMPDLLDLTGTILAEDGSPVLLPISGDVQTRIRRGDLRLSYDVAKGDAWATRIAMTGLDRSDIAAESAILSGSGTIARAEGQRGIEGKLDFDLSGLDRLDQALLDSLGTAVKGSTTFAAREGADGFDISQISLSGNGYELTGSALVEGLESAMKITGAARLETPDLAQFSPLAGRPLGGAGVVQLSGWGSPLSGAFDVNADVQARGLKSGVAELDRMLTGQTKLTASVLRDETGMTLRSFDGTAASLRLTASGKLATAGSDLKGHLDWGNLADLGGSYSGALSVDVTAGGTTDDGRLTLTGTADGLRIGQPEVDRLIAGRSDLSADVGLKAGVIRLNDLKLNGSQLSATVAEEASGDLRVSGRLNNLALIAPEFPGPVTLSGRIRPEGTGADVDLRVQGPAAIDARLTGRVDGNRPDLTVTGTSDAAVANGFTDPVTLAGAIRYDIRLANGWSPNNASGRITLSNGRVAVPARGMSLERMAVAADLSGGTAQLTVTADTSGGGKLRLNGPLSLNAPYNAGLALRVDGAKLRDPELYDTTLGGTLNIDGPLLGNARAVGRFALGETELRVPSTGFASGADLEAVRHEHDTAAVRATRVRAGVGTSTAGTAGTGGSSLPNWAIDLEIRAPNRVFIRGRGLDAELGGAIRVGGTLNALIPSGGMELIRGRLDILGKRLTLNEATLQLEGDFVPYLTVSASNVSGDVTSYVNITGRADDPQVSFTSDPEMAQEEVLAWLLFGRGLDSISAFQAAQLAGAVATLAGRSGLGLVGKLRQGLGVDDLDVQTSEDGNTSVSAGKYISRNVYTEVGVDQSGNTRINLNFDVKPGVTVKGRLDGDGESGIGIYLEKDY